MANSEVVFKASADGFYLNNDYINDSNYYRQISEAKAHFLRTGEILPVVRAPIAESWRNDKRNGYSPDSTHSPCVLTSGEMQSILEKYRLLINVGSSVIDSICRTLTKIDFSLQLYNADGVLLYLNNEHDPHYKWMVSPTTKIGVNATDGAGTNAINLALKYNSEFSVYGPEHYLEQYYNLTNCAVPIRGSSNELIGLLNISYRADTRTELLASLSLIGANLIARQMQNISYSSVLESTFDNINERVLVVDANMHITLANSSFQNMLGDGGASVIGKNISLLFYDAQFLDAIKSGRNGKYPDITLHYFGKTYRLSIRSCATFCDGIYTGTVLLCQEIQKILAWSQKYTPSAIAEFSSIITNDTGMKQLIHYCSTAAKTDASILLEGESGTGKELFAQAIHNASPRIKKPFIAINCAAIPISLIESELFGYEKGSFTGALNTGKIGKFEQANGGTLFLDEIGELPLDVQGKLLRVLESRRVLRIGAKDETPLDIRIISATNRNLQEMVNEHSFRADLFYRLNVMCFLIPPLRSRNGDVQPLAEYFLHSLNENNGTAKFFSGDTIAKMNKYSWQGNVRELQNAVTRAYYMCDTHGDDKIMYDDLVLPETRSDVLRIVNREPISPLKSAEKQLVERALEAHGGDIKTAAETLNMPLSTMYKRIKQYGINVHRIRAGG